MRWDLKLPSLFSLYWYVRELRSLSFLFNKITSKALTLFRLKNLGQLFIARIVDINLAYRLAHVVFHFMPATFELIVF